MEIKRQDLKDGQVVWGCAYCTNNTEKSMAFKKKPVLGVVSLKEKAGRWSRDGVFYESRKDGQPKKSSGVNLYARHYANTEEESREIYNGLVQNQIDLLQRLIDDTKSDFIE